MRRDGLPSFPYVCKSRDLHRSIIGSRIDLSEKTVKNYLSTVFEKLHVSRRAEAAVIYAQEQQR